MTLNKIRTAKAATFFERALDDDEIRILTKTPNMTAIIIKGDRKKKRIIKLLMASGVRTSTIKTIIAP